MEWNSKKLVIKRAYPVKCLHCDWEGNANMGKSAIQTVENGGEEWCPVCGCMSLVGKNYAEVRKQNEIHS